MLIITLPVIFPAVVALGFDPIAFGVIIVILGGCAVIMPPIGMLVFAASAMTDIKVADIFRGVLPFYTALLAALVLLLIFPGVATWLPNMMRGG